MRNRLYGVASIVVVGVIIFVSIKLLTFSFYKGPEEKIVATTYIDGFYRIIELNPDKTMELTAAKLEDNEVMLLAVKYEVHGESVSHIAGPLYYKKAFFPWNSVLWVPDKDKKPYIVKPRILEIIPKSSEDYKRDFELGNTLLMIGDHEVMLGPITYERNASIPAWVHQAISQ